MTEVEERLERIESLLKRFMAPAEIPEEPAWMALAWLADHLEGLSTDETYSAARRSICFHTARSVRKAVTEQLEKRS